MSSWRKLSMRHNIENELQFRGGLPYERGGDARPLVRGVNFGFWSHLGYSGQNAIIFSPQGLV